MQSSGLQAGFPEAPRSTSGDRRPRRPPARSPPGSPGPAAPCPLAAGFPASPRLPARPAPRSPPRRPGSALPAHPAPSPPGARPSPRGPPQPLRAGPARPARRNCRLGGDSSRRPPGRFLSSSAGWAPSLGAAAGAGGRLLGALKGFPLPLGRENRFSCCWRVFLGD